jgi:lysophospholipase L1-like esterase
MMTWRGKWVIGVLYVGVVALMLEGAAWVVVTWSDHALGNRSERFLFSPIRGHELNPEYRRAYDTQNRKIHSPQGFRRDGVVSVAKPPGTFRIVALGGSALYGEGMESEGLYPRHRAQFNDETVAAVLERDLNERLERTGSAIEVEVINAGIPVYESFQHVLYVFETIYEYEPDMLILFDGHNDFYNTGRENPIKNYTYASFDLARSLNERKPFLSLFMAVHYLGHFNAIRLHGALGANFAARLETWATIDFLRNYKLIEALGRYHGFTYHVFLQPESVFENDRFLSPHDIAVKRTTEAGYGADAAALMKEARRLFPALFAKHDIPYTEIGAIATAATADQKLYIDHVHLTPAGARIAAQRMLPVVLERVRRQLLRAPTLQPGQPGAAAGSPRRTAARPLPQ